MIVRACPLLLLIASLTVAAAENPSLAGLPAEVLEAEQRRVEVVEKITPATIAIFDDEGEGGGSGVIISPEGYALTNFHVVAPCGPLMLCGLPDGSLVEAVLVGLDPTGDIALVRLEGGRDYPFAEVGDSAQAAIGDEVFVAGNPFLLADDFRPTITHGVLSGTRRYQYPAGTVLEYADCLQTDAAINPGNSGGPIYDNEGKLIGINGRASFEKRGRVNVGVGYAVSINQVMRFVGQLKSGRVVDHGVFGATVRTTADRRVLIDAIDDSSDAFRRGLRYGDQVLSVDGRRVTSANALMNAIATRPAAWRTRIKFRNSAGDQEVWVRLEPRHTGSELERVVESQLVPLKADDNEEASGNVSALAEQYEHRPGFSNYAVNRRQVEWLLRACPQRQASDRRASWKLIGKDAAGEGVLLTLGDQRSEAAFSKGRFWVEASRPLEEQAGPPGSGGLLVALHAWRQLLTAEEDTLKRFKHHGPTPWGDRGEMADKVVVAFGQVDVEYYFDPSDARLIGIEAWTVQGADPCRLAFSDFQTGTDPAQGEAPGRVIITHGDTLYADWTLEEFYLHGDETSGGEH